MKISFHMNLSELAEHMGDANELEARFLRVMLAERGYSDTEEVSDDVWQSLLERAAFLGKL